MQLLGSNTSPYVRKVRLVLLEKNIPHQYLVDSPQESNSMVHQVNPLGRIPALILADGFCVFDSPVIADYVDTLNDTPILIPRHDALARLRVKRWEALADGIMDSAIVVRNEALRPTQKQQAETVTLHQTAVSQAVQCAARWLGDDEWCAENKLSLADLALVSALLYLDLRQPEYDWRGSHTNLAKWFGCINARESVQETLR